jgi:hypothetical protein
MAATTAVVAGTAGAVSHHQQQKYAQKDAEQQAQPQYQQAPPPQYEEAAPEEPAYMAELQQLAQLKNQGVISNEEFEAKKKQILGL